MFYKTVPIPQKVVLSIGSCQGDILGLDTTHNTQTPLPYKTYTQTSSPLQTPIRPLHNLEPEKYDTAAQLYADRKTDRKTNKYI